MERIPGDGSPAARTCHTELPASAPLSDSPESGALPRSAFRLRIAGGFASLRGWRRWCAATLSGLLAATAQPPLLLLPALFAGFAGLLWLLAGASGARQRWFDGWLFGIGYFGAGLYWIAAASENDANRLPWLVPAITVGLVLVLALFPAAAALAAGRRPLRPAGILAFAGAFTLFEWVRGWILSGFAWNPVGNIWIEVLPVLQAASWFGVYGLTFATVYAAAGLAALALRERGAGAAALSGVLLLAGLAAAGAVRLSGAPADSGGGAALRIVQPHVASRGNWTSSRQAEIFRRLTRMTGQDMPAGAVVIWPEVAMPYVVQIDAESDPRLAGLAPEGGYLITGAVRYRYENDRQAEAWNGLIAVDDEARIVAQYQKHHLVPLGEYVPFPELFGLRRVTWGRLNFSPGPGLALLDLPGLVPFAPQICYEIIFPDAAVDRSAPRPAWLLSLTNDGWFGETAGPYQHFASARMRAVEEGAPLVRAANTGISAVTDAYGRVTHRLEPGARGVIDARLPPPSPSPTLFSRYGNAAAAIPVLLAGLFLAARRLPAIFRYRRAIGSGRKGNGADPALARDR